MDKPTFGNILIQRVHEAFEYQQEELKTSEIKIEEIEQKTPEQETPRIVKRKYDSSDKPTDGNIDEQTPKNQAIKLAGSPYDSSEDMSTVRSRKAHKSKLTDNKLSPMR